MVVKSALIPVEGMPLYGELEIDGVLIDDGRHYFHFPFACGPYVWTKGRCSDRTLCVMKLPPEG